MSLVDDWKNAWRWFSMNCMVIATAIQGAWVYIPEDLKTNIPASLVSTVTILLLILGIAGRLIKQDKKDV